MAHYFPYYHQGQAHDADQWCNTLSPYADQRPYHQGSPYSLVVLEYIDSRIHENDHPHR